MERKNLVQRIEAGVSDALHPEKLEVKDEGAQHKGHAGSGHFYVYVVAEIFEGKSWVERHRLIYGALADLLKEEIHALRIEAKTPTEEA